MSVNQAEVLPFRKPVEELPSHEELVREFTLDLYGRPIFRVKNPSSEIARVEQVEPVSLDGHPLHPKINLYQIEVIDPYVRRDAQASVEAGQQSGYDFVSQKVAQWEEMVETYGFNPHYGRTQATRSSKHNPLTAAWADSNETVKLWRELVPRAEALFYLNHPTPGRRILVTGSRDGVDKTSRITREGGIQLQFVADGIAMRDRSKAMQAVAEDHYARQGEANRDIRWLSLASGAAEPSLKAAKGLMGLLDNDVFLTVVDRNPTSLKHVQDNASRVGIDFSKQVEVIDENILRPDLKYALSRESKRSNQLYDVVEIMGFMEYLPQEGDVLGAKKFDRLPQASDFVKKAYDFVRPGGILITGNMIYPRPQLNFVFGVVDWPIINARREEDIVRVLAQAGILDDPRAQVDLFRIVNHDKPEVHVYDIVRVTKHPLLGRYILRAAS